MSGRADLPLLRVYASEQAHSSIRKIRHHPGPRPAQPAKNSRRRAVSHGRARRSHTLIEEDRQAGMLPCCVVATVGTTSTSSIDPVPAIADICESNKLWYTSDAAYAGSAAIVPELRHVLAGCDRADSLVTNPHKWLFTPVRPSPPSTPRRPEALRQAFSLVPEYLRTGEGEDVRNLMDYGIQLGRRFRALKLWMVIRYFGHEGLAARIRETLPPREALRRLGRAIARLGIAGRRSLQPGLLPRLPRRAGKRRGKRNPPRLAQRAADERRQRNGENLPLAHETPRPLHAAPRRRQHSHDRRRRSPPHGNCSTKKLKRLG